MAVAPPDLVERLAFVRLAEHAIRPHTTAFGCWASREGSTALPHIGQVLVFVMFIHSASYETHGAIRAL